tara:strand:+ start:453 stop:794 length:342 start_codon:yes stop_codon:yes gene_type:complete
MDNNLILKYIKNPLFISLFTAISSDPSPSNSWSDLYSNIFFRFVFIFIVVYQSGTSLDESIFLTVSTMGFFYLIGSKKEKKEILSNNFRKKDLKTFLYFIIFMYILYIFRKSI